MAGRTVDGKPLEAFISDGQRALIPEESGNAINGLGEAAPRRPSPIYWHSRRRRHVYAPLQMWMLEKTSREVPETAELDSGLGGRGARDRVPQAAQRERNTPAGWARQVKAFALAHEADLVGIARLDPEWVFEGYAVDAPWVVMLGVAMDHAALSEAPEPGSMLEVMRAYNRGTRAARALADWILAGGYAAEAEGSPVAGKITLIPPALACGFGELGKHGSIINRRLGSSFRLASVLTDLPLVADAADAFGVDDFCTHCRLCETACPPDAIAPAPSKPCAGTTNGMSISTGACRTSTRPTAAASASRSVHGAGPAWRRHWRKK